MHIRRGTFQDADAIATYLLMAMEDITYSFIGKQDYQEAHAFLKTLVEHNNNQYAYQHNWVIEENGEAVGTALVYDGAQLAALREPVGQLIADRYQREFNPENETQEGEYYIDCIAVSQSQRGKGIGSKVLSFLIEEYVQKQQATLGLLVDLDNPAAKKLYLRMGFEVVAPKTLLGKQLEHMQISPQQLQNLKD